ncbi:DNA gyrase subunit A [Labilithrix luteola]|uniref:DNA gyrase subunit A n=1 Tax=Labilithrix luteola TaxID=1391654 RepID=A0A0K1Q9L7_9BACT|nr:DNA gyrase subunit A [Labilithrix luteola]AKV02110.1 DNA gyrase subunit A [Labilithrix luteola]
MSNVNVPPEPNLPGSPAQPPSNGQKVPISIQEEMRTSYLDYAMSVIVGRAIPDARDGLKPVHRRIMYSAYQEGLVPSAAYRKSATIVGAVLGSYHPHGDASVYDAMVRLAQDFSLRYPLIDGQGNYGSVDGDPAAAYRYTEARLSKIAVEFLSDIEKECVDFVPNFDDSKVEPTVLPTRIPNLLVNGSGGIAVGMATNIPPHNLGEVLDATVHLIRNPQCTVDDLMRFVAGPDFPTGALIFGRGGIEQAQRTGRGNIIMRARMEVERAPGRGDKEQIVVTEIPYQTNKARIHARIGELMREKKIEGISEARDESDREGIRLVIELKKDVVPQVVINQLYRLTDLQTSFGVINLAIVRGRPMVMNLKESLDVFVEHRRDVVTRRTRYELRQAEAQREIVEGLGMATTEVDLVVRTIRESRDVETARSALMKLPLKGLEAFVRRAGRPDAEIERAKEKGDYFLSERQAKAILEMRLSKLTGLEQEKLAAEYGELCNEIARLRNILANESVLFDLIVMELEEIRSKFADKRKTEIVANDAEIADEDMIQEEDMVVTISHAGYIKRTHPSAYRAQKRGGKGKIGMEAREEDWVTQLFVASTHAYVFFFSDRGKVYVKKVYEIPIAARNAKGRAIVNFVGMEPGEKVAAIVEIPKIEEGKFVVTITKRGQIKKTAVTEYENFRQKGIIGVKIEGDDQLLSAALTNGGCELLIATKLGQSIRFAEDQVRSMGRGTVGVKAIDVADDDQVVGMAVTDPERPFVLAVCENGYGKRTNLEEFRQQNRGGKGIILIDASERNGPVVDVKLVKDGDEIMLITDKGQTLRTAVAEVRETGRNAQGVKIMSVEEGERIVALERMAEQPAGAEGGPEGGSEGGSEDGGSASELPPDDGSGGAAPAGSETPGEGELN